MAEADLSKEPPATATLCGLVWHISGNLESRFTGFRTSDGEKPTRDRDSEFVPRDVTRAELVAKWEQGWAPLLEEVQALTDADLAATVVIGRSRCGSTRRCIDRWRTRPTTSDRWCIWPSCGPAPASTR